MLLNLIKYLSKENIKEIDDHILKLVTVYTGFKEM